MEFRTRGPCQGGLLVKEELGHISVCGDLTGVNLDETIGNYAMSIVFTLEKW